jgi:hypothetical protein
MNVPSSITQHLSLVVGHQNTPSHFHHHPHGATNDGAQRKASKANYKLLFPKARIIFSCWVWLL